MAQAVTVYIPTALRRFTGGLDVVPVRGSTVAEVLENLSAEYEGIGERVLAVKDGRRSFLRIYRRDEDIDSLEGLLTSVVDGDEISIVMAVAGG